MICKVCKLEKGDSFYKCNHSVCKDCLKKRAKKYREANLEKIRKYDRNRPNKQERVERCKEYKAKLRTENPEKFDKIFHGKRKRYRHRNAEKCRAEDKLNYAVRQGKIKKPNKCSLCGISCEPQGHHFDYTKPYEVIWLCAKCHSKVHHNKNQEK